MTEFDEAAAASQTSEYSDYHRAALEFAHLHGLSHEYSRTDLVSQWSRYPFGIGHWRRARNVLSGALHGHAVTAFEYRYILYSDDETNEYERDALFRFLVCVASLNHPVPRAAAVRRNWHAHHPSELHGQTLPVAYAEWDKAFVLLSPDPAFALAVLTEDVAAQLASTDQHVEWRFVDDELLLWIRGARLKRHMTTLLGAAATLIAAAETVSLSGDSHRGDQRDPVVGAA